MAGTITVTTSKERNIYKYSCACVSDASGDVNATNVSVRGGQLVQVVMTPDSGGTQPSDLYDVTLTLAGGGTDLLGAGGANCSQTTQVVVGADNANLPTYVPAGNVRPVIANAGNAKGVTIDLYFI